MCITLLYKTLVMDYYNQHFKLKQNILFHVYVVKTIIEIYLYFNLFSGVSNS